MGGMRRYAVIVVALITCAVVLIALHAGNQTAYISRTRTKARATLTQSESMSGKTASEAAQNESKDAFQGTPRPLSTLPQGGMKSGPEPRLMIDEYLRRFEDTSIPLKQRVEEINALAKNADEHSIKVLMALGDEKTYLNFAAVRALGNCPGEKVAQYLTKKLSDPDWRVLCEAVCSYAKVRGKAAIPDIVRAIENNHERHDGFEKEVCTMAVMMLGEIASKDAVPALISELERSEEKGWNLAYGSTVIAALGRIDTFDARSAISGYAERLSARLPDDPLARKYYEDKIAEAKEAAKRH